MSTENEGNVKTITLAELGVNIPDTAAQKNEAAAPEATSGVITPNAVGGVGDGEKVDIGEIAAFAPRAEPGKVFEENSLKLIDENIERVKKDLQENVIGPMKDNMIAAKLEAEANETSESDKISVAPRQEHIQSAESKIMEAQDLSVLEDMSRFSIDDEDLKDLLDEEDDADLEKQAKEDEEEEKKKEKEDAEEHERQKQIYKEYQSQIKSTVKVVSNAIDLKEFRISTKPVSITKALGAATKQINTAQWALPNSKRLVTFSELSGEEITNLNPENFKNRMHAFRTAYSIMFNHLVDPNKPKNMDVWLKTICGFDINHLYFALYRATFMHNNHLTYNCPICANLELKTSDIDDMVRYPNEKVKAEFQHLLATGEDTTPSALEPKLVQVSENYVFAMRAPHVYGIIFETSALNEEFTTKYADILSVLSYIECVYLIDTQTKNLIPIDTKPDPDNVTKTVKNKVVAYYNIIKQLTSDQYGLIGSEVNEINQLLKNDIIYQIPETDCTGTTKANVKCTHHFEPEAMLPLDLLFLRHQLVAIGNSSIE
jgi:hypothetical protein